jgi:hypothetical protein
MGSETGGSGEANTSRRKEGRRQKGGGEEDCGEEASEEVDQRSSYFCRSRSISRWSDYRRIKYSAGMESCVLL